MTQLSNTAAIVCCAVVAMGMAGCNNNSSSGTTTAPVSVVPVVPVVPGASCTTPAAVTAVVTLDQNNTKTALSTALVTQEIGYMLSDGGMYMSAASEKSAQEPKKVSKPASILSAKIQTLQKNTADVKKSVSSIGDGSLIYGDDVACDVSGTYTLHDTGSSNNEDGLESSMDQLTLSFNACVMEDTYGNEMLDFFKGMTLYSSVLNSDRIEASSTYAFNGSLSLEYNSDYTYSYDYWNDDPQPLDSGSSSVSKSSGISHWVTNGISVEYTENGMLASRFTSTEELSVTFNSTYSNENNATYETDFNQGDYTQNYKDAGQNTWNATFQGSESEQMFGDVNTTASFSACNVSVEGTSTYSGIHQRLYVDYSQVSYEDRYSGQRSTKLNGYLVMQDGEEGFDLYANDLMVNDTYTDVYSYNYQTSEYNTSNTSELSLNGTVGSTLIGGSAVLDTQNPWLMSSEYPENRSSVQPEEIGYYYGFYVDYSPYAGKTVLTGTNSATVEFMLDDANLTYGTITVEGEAPVEYDNIETMGIAYID